MVQSRCKGLKIIVKSCFRGNFLFTCSDTLAVGSSGRMYGSFSRNGAQHSITNGQTDRQQYHANSQSYCMQYGCAVWLAKASSTLATTGDYTRLQSPKSATIVTVCHRFPATIVASVDEA